MISTHVPRVGYDEQYGADALAKIISTHVPRVGYDGSVRLEKMFFVKFQLTYPVWGTTVNSAKEWKEFKFQLTYPVWGTTLMNFVHRYIL